MFAFSSLPTARLDPLTRLDALRLAERVAGVGAPHYLASRFERYATLHQAHRSSGLAALMLTDHADWNGVALHYVGPVFSTRRAYLPLFQQFVSGLCDTQRPFVMAAEVESPLVARDMRRMLPRWIYPNVPVSPVPASLRAAAAAMAAAFPHIEDIDLEALTTRRTHTPRRGLAGLEDRYQLLLLPCFGEAFSVHDLRKDLSHEPTPGSAERAPSTFRAG